MSENSRTPESSKRIATACIAHETNAFSNVASDLKRFKEHGLYEVEAFKFLSDTRIGGAFIEIAEQEKFELIPTVQNNTLGWGIFTNEAFGYLLGIFLEGLECAGNIDGVLLQLHGAMVTKKPDDVQGQVLERIR